MQKRCTFVPCHWIHRNLSQRYSELIDSALLSAYALTGCDTVSYIFSCGNRRALKVALECHQTLEPFSDYGAAGSDAQVSEDIVDSAMKYMCALYGKRDFHGTLDELRCYLFKTDKSDIRFLPPTSDAFILLKRALYQILIWKRAVLSSMSLPPPTDYGRNVDNG